MDIDFGSHFSSLERLRAIDSIGWTTFQQRAICSSHSIQRGPDRQRDIVVNGLWCCWVNDYSSSIPTKCAQSLTLSQAGPYCRITRLHNGATVESHGRRAGDGSHSSDWTEKASNHHPLHCQRLLRGGKSSAAYRHAASSIDLCQNIKNMQAKKKHLADLSMSQSRLSRTDLSQSGLEVCWSLTTEYIVSNIFRTVSKISGLLRSQQVGSFDDSRHKNLDCNLGAGLLDEQSQRSFFLGVRLELLRQIGPS